MRLSTVAVALLALFVLTACSSGEPSTIGSTREPPSPTITPAPTPSPSPVTFTSVIAVPPTASPTPVPIYHGGPYTVAIEAGHGGPNWLGAAGYGASGERLIEKNLTLDTALRLDELLREAGFETVLVRNDAEVGGDPNNAHSYLLGTNDGFRPSLMPGVISEPLFLSSANDAERIAEGETRQRLAEAYRDGIVAYFAWLQS